MSLQQVSLKQQFWLKKTKTFLFAVPCHVLKMYFNKVSGHTCIVSLLECRK